MTKVISYVCDVIFVHEISPLQHIRDFNVRHMVFQMLGLMWALSLSIAISSYTFLAFSLIGHAFLIGAAAITVATYTTATVRPQLLARKVRQQPSYLSAPASTAKP